jgi:bacillopeptidase F (M6 metalloprotease family)
MVLSWLGSLLGGPFAKAAVQAYQAKLTSDNSAEKTAADLAARELAVQQRELELQAQGRVAEIGRWYEPDKLIGYCVAAYFAKLLVWDKVLGLGTTDPLAGFASVTANLVVSFYFAKRGFENVTRILKR